MLIVHFHTGLLAVSFHLLVRAIPYMPCIKKSPFLIKFCGDLADKPGGVVVREGC